MILPWLFIEHYPRINGSYINVGESWHSIAGFCAPEYHINWATGQTVMDFWVDADESDVGVVTSRAF